MTKKNDANTPENNSPKPASELLPVNAGEIFAQHSEEQLEMNRLFGRMEMATAITEITTSYTTTWFKRIKENESFKLLQGQTITKHGTVYKLHLWEDFCRSMGTSPDTVNEQIKQLDKLGEDAYYNAKEIGVTARQLKIAVRLDGDDAEQIKTLLESKDTTKDDVYQYLENKINRSEKDKAELEEKLKSTLADAEANEKIISKKNETIDKLEKQIVKRENMTIDETIKEAMLDMGVAEVTALSAIHNISEVFKASFKDGEFIANPVEHRAATVLLNVRNNLDDLLNKYQLQYVELNQEIDDSWADNIEDDSEDQPQLPLN